MKKELGETIKIEEKSYKGTDILNPVTEGRHKYLDENIK
jgi:hypothetical protein